MQKKENGSFVKTFDNYKTFRYIKTIHI